MSNNLTAQKAAWLLDLLHGNIWPLSMPRHLWNFHLDNTHTAKQVSGTSGTSLLSISVQCCFARQFCIWNNETIARVAMFEATFGLSWFYGTKHWGYCLIGLIFTVLWPSSVYTHCTSFVFCHVRRQRLLFVSRCREKITLASVIKCHWVPDFNSHNKTHVAKMHVKWSWIWMRGERR